MMNFKRLPVTHNVPVYFQKMRARDVAIRLVVFVGAADDTSFGAPGLYHWFEHAPFRGTRSFPKGYKDTLSRFDRRAGEINASTSHLSTTFEAHVRRDDWCEALQLVTELAAWPRLTTAGIHAEREIIYQEICEADSSAEDCFHTTIKQLLWENHPLATNILGTEQGLASMNPDLLRHAHQSAYDRSRCAYIVVGNIDESQLIDHLNAQIATIPSRGLPARTQDHKWGPLPAWSNQAFETDYAFPISMVAQLWRSPFTETSYRNDILLSFLQNTFSMGMAAPLARIVREQRQLVYDTNMASEQFPDGGFLSFIAQTVSRKIPKVRQAFRDVWRDNQVRSKVWFNDVKASMLAHYNMRSPTPLNYCGEAEYQVSTLGYTHSEKEMLRLIRSITYAEFRTLLDSFDPDTFREVVLRGTD